jgi:CHAD domain-containing protein
MKKQRAKKGGKRSAEEQLPRNAEAAVCVFGAGINLKHLSALEQEAEGLRAGEEDIELIHRARVATRRLRAALPLFSQCFKPKNLKKWLEDIRDITRALGAARDSDVQIELVQKVLEKIKDDELRPGVERLLVRLQQQREQAQPDVADAVTAFFEKDLITELHETLDPLNKREDEVIIHTPALYLHSAQSITSRLEEFLAYHEIIFDPEKVTELHEMRIAAKRLRYTMEVFAPLYSEELKEQLQAVRKIQDLLGDIHDCDVWMEFLPEFVDLERVRTRDYYGSEEPFARLAPGIEYFRRSRFESRQTLYRELLVRWQTWQDENMWAGLQAEIQQPLLQPKQFYPPLKA